MSKVNKPDVTVAREIVETILFERARQIAKGFTPEHDDDHKGGEIARAAAVYAAFQADGMSRDVISQLWRWSGDALHPGEARRNLIRAAALIVAEIERLDRAAANSSK